MSSAPNKLDFISWSENALQLVKMRNVQLHILEDVIGMRIDLTQKCLGLFVHNRVVLIHSATAKILMERATVLSPHISVGHQTKGPAKVRPN